MSDTLDELANVVVFPIGAEDIKAGLTLRIEDETHHCHHRAYYVNEAERVVKCQKCGALVDPFTVLLSIAHKETNLANSLRYLRDEERQRRKNIEKLAQIERNAKARIRRAEGKKP